MKNQTIRALALSAVAAATSAGALAQDSILEKSIFKVGIARYDTHSKTSGISGIGIPAGADAKTGDATTIILNYEYMATPQFGIEFVLGIPPKITADGSGSIAFLGEVVSARNVAPTLLFNWHFGEPADRWRPYVGAGVNYTRFTDVRSPYPYKVDLGDSWGPAAVVGIDYRIDRNWGAFGSVTALKVKSDLVAVGANVLTATIDFRPVVYAVGLSYRF
jgi:outer membrane protein